MSFRVYIHDNPSNLAEKREILTEYRGLFSSLRPSLIRRNELAQLISNTESIPTGLLAMWSDSPIQPTFLSRIISDPKNQLSSFIGSTTMAPPDAPEDILVLQDDAISRVGGVVVKSHDSLIHWVVDSRIKEIHAINIRILINGIMRKSGGDYIKFRNLYYSRVYPWAPIMNDVHPTQIIEGTTTVFEEPQNMEIPSKSVVTDILERLRILSEIKIDDDTEEDTTGFINFVKLRLIPSLKISTAGSPPTIPIVSEYMGLQLPYNLEPTGDRGLDINLAELFETIKIGTGARQIHAIIFNDPLQPHNGRVRIATSEIRDGSVRQACLDEKLIRSFRSQEIQKTTEDDSKITDYLSQKILPGTVDNNKPYIRIVFSIKELPKGLSVFPDELISEFILYKDGQIQAYLVDINMIDTLVYYILLISDFVKLPKTMGYRPIVQEIKSQFDTVPIFKPTQSIKTSRKLLSDVLVVDSTITRETSRDDIYDDLFRMQYLRVNLPKDIVLSDEMTPESIRKRVSVLLLANFDNTQLTNELGALRVSPGDILSAIGMLPDGKKPEDFQVMTQAHRIMYNNALDAYRHSIEEEQENLEVSRIREEEGVENIVPDIQFRNNRDGSMTVFVFGCPNVEILQNIKGYIQSRLKNIGDETRVSVAPLPAPLSSPLPGPLPGPLPSPPKTDESVTRVSPPAPAQPSAPALSSLLSTLAKVERKDESANLELDLGDDKSVPVSTSLPRPLPTGPTLPSPPKKDESANLELDLGDDTSTPLPRPLPRPLPTGPTLPSPPKEDESVELELDLGGDTSAPLPNEPRPLPTVPTLPSQPKEDESANLELDLGDDTSAPESVS